MLCYDRSPTRTSCDDCFWMWQECSSLGIEGKNVTGELRELTKSLPQLLFKAAGTLQADKVRDAAQYYHLHVADMAQESESRTSGSAAPLLPTLAAAERAHLEMPAQAPLLLQTGALY